MLFRNGFKGGMNKDADASVMPSDFYTDAHNLTLVGDGSFFALENIKGTTELGTIVGSFSGEVMAVYENKYTIAGTAGINCLTVFTSQTGGDFQIWCYRLDTNVTYKLFNQTFDAPFEAANPEIDAVTYPEGGMDIVYFTDNYNEMRKLRCEIPVAAPDNFLSEQDLSLQRRATLATATYTPQTSGGSLLSGSYQFCFRMFNEDTRSYSKWTIPSWPVNISSSEEGYYGFATTKKIDISFRLVDSEIPFWTHFQVGVVEHTVAEPQTLLSIQNITSLSGGVVNVVGFTDYAESYKSNDKIYTTPLADVVVDLAAIEKVKTLQVKNNRLFAGNISYHDLQYDRTPTVTGSTTTQATDDATDDASTTAYRGYFRDETYRYYAVYWDDFYNFSRPKMLDMTGISGNIGVGPDMHFGRSVAKQNSSNQYLNLGLSLTLNNHPSWARGFAIFRAKRKKKKIFQSPFIPAVEVSGIEVIGDYPNMVNELDAAGTGIIQTELPDATPMNPVGTAMPKSFFHCITQHIIRASIDNSTYKIEDGEVCFQTSEWYNGPAKKLGFLFEPYAQYGIGTPYTVKPSDKLYIADVAFTRMDFLEFSSGTTDGEDVRYSAHGVFYADRSTDYWRDYSTPSPSWPLGSSRTLDISDYTLLDNFGEGTSLGGVDVCKFSNLNTVGVDVYQKPNTQKMGVIQYAGMTDITYYSDNFKSGKISSTYKKTAVSAVPSAGNTADNTPVHALGGYSDNSTIINAVAIVDIENNLDDSRYGDPEMIHDVVFTGVAYTFSDSEVSTVVASGNVPKAITVFGGDCYVSLHSFKISDNHYAITADDKWRTLSTSALSKVQAWKRTFYNKHGFTTSMPVGFKNLSQVISVVLESEVNGEVLAKRPYTSSAPTGGNITVPTLSSTDEGATRIPFNYLYNRGYTQVSDQKVLIPFNEDETPTVNYRARGIFSDQKVYNTDIQGFDVFRISNFFDLEETYYGITKLALDGDNLIALQERAVAYIPVDAAMLSTTDADTISVRSGTVDLPTYLSRLNGCTNMKAVVQAGDALFFPDVRNQRMFKLKGGQLEPISDKGMVKQFNTDFTSATSNIKALYDNNRSQYWLYSPTYCYVWDARLNLWVADYDVSPQGGVFTADGLLTVKREGTDLNVYSMYTGAYNSMYGTDVVPTVSVIVNPEFELNKTFDVVTSYSTNKPLKLDILSNKENGAFGHESLGNHFDYNRREGYYQSPTLRDAYGARIRGTNAALTVYWPEMDEKITMSQLITFYRTSPRTP